MRRSGARAIIFCGLAIAITGLALAWWSAGGQRSSIPPGLIILPVTLLVPVLVRGAWGSGLPLVATILLLGALLAGSPGGELLGTPDLQAGAGRWLQVGGLIVAAVASTISLREERTNHDPVLRKAPLPPERAGLWRLVLLLLVLAPVCAEYLAAYDATTGDPLELLGGLLIFVPLYGAPALLIREIARRIGLSWPGMLLLGAAFGLMQAGVVDQSLFSASYRGLEEWAAERSLAYVPVLGLSAHQLLSFVGGHAIYSICAPVALVEAMRPGVRREPWLGASGMAIAAAFYAAASWLVLRDHLATEASHASTLQIVGSLAVVALLLFGAMLTGGMRHRQVERRAPAPGTVLVAALVTATAMMMLPDGWPGAVGTALLLVMTGWALLAWSRRRAWGLPQEVAVASGFVLSRALLAFTYSPVFGEVEALPKYLHNVVLLVGVGLVCIVAYRRAASHPGAAIGR